MIHDGKRSGLIEKLCLCLSAEHVRMSMEGSGRTRAASFSDGVTSNNNDNNNNNNNIIMIIM